MGIPPAQSINTGIQAMNISGVQVSIATAASLVIFTISGVFTVEYRYAKAEDIKQFQYQQAIRDDRQWLEIMEEKLKDAKTAEEKERIKRQIQRTEESLFINMGKIK